ncbi:MAG: CDP-glucose 4,6-dehydratase [Endomicrobia bacterium]|nr:CDP-glucose 4,6-dehydratase [Endomicrobiia bacterium]MCL2799010.1 CDP-glucose 4,6-dehydratase [Endomicrobiia bacterium]
MLNFFKNKKILITGHTGFKGSWLCKILNFAGAHVTGYALLPSETPNLFNLAEISKDIDSVFADIRDLVALKKTVSAVKPEIIIHMAAQPLVRESYKNPAYTYETNVMGTVNILEASRECKTVKSFLNVTTDKVYKNNKSGQVYKESDELNGQDPYSNSKSCSELITESYKKSFFKNTRTAISTVRSGNVIGGGDFSDHRLIPDAVKALSENKPLILRNPGFVRPYQHVTETIFAYLLIVKKQYEHKKYEGNYNIGPEMSEYVKIEQLANMFYSHFKEPPRILQNHNEQQPFETDLLMLNTEKIKTILGWKPSITLNKAVDMTAEWTKAYMDKKNFNEIMDSQIKEYYGLIKDIYE